MIDRDHALSVTKQAEAVGIVRSTVYHLAPGVGRRPGSDEADPPAAHGVPLRGRSDVATHAGYIGVRARQGRSPATRSSYLLRGLEIIRPNQAWAMAITNIPMASFVFLAVVLDWFELLITMEAAFCVETLEEALATHGKPEIFNTDQGSQFTGTAFIGVLAKPRSGSAWTARARGGITCSSSGFCAA